MLLVAGSWGAAPVPAQDTVFDFEPRDGPETQYTGPRSWRYLFDPLEGPGHPAYAAGNIRLAPDPAGRRAGVYADHPGIVLEIPFDGNPVGLRTREPLPAPPGPAYELSLYARAERLSRTRAWCELAWLSVRDGEERALRSDRLELPAGQVDWPEEPLRLRAERPPGDANFVHLYVRLSPDAPDAPPVAGYGPGDWSDRHGLLWLDDITFGPRPRIDMDPVTLYAPAAAAGGEAPPGPRRPRVRVDYRGLPPAPGDGAAGWTREAALAAVDGRPPADPGGRTLPQPFAPRAPLPPAPPPEGGRAPAAPSETIEVSLERWGVYYLTLRLRDPGGREAASATQAIVLAPERPRGDAGPGPAARRPGFGLRLDRPPESLLGDPGAVARWLERAGVSWAKFDAWAPGPGGGPDPAYGEALSREAIGWRRLARLVAVVAPVPPESGAGPPGVDRFVERPETLAPWMDDALPRVGARIDRWQWGRDGGHPAGSSAGSPGPLAARRTLAARAGNAPQMWPAALDGLRGPFGAGQAGDGASLHARVPETAAAWWDGLALAAPWTLAPLAAEAGLPAPGRYPPPELLRAAREATLRINGDGGPGPGPVRPADTWVSFALPPLPEGVRAAGAERRQLDALLRGVALAAAAGGEVIFPAILADPAEGLLAGPAPGRPGTGWHPRPAFLGLSTAVALLDGARYLGALPLPPPAEAHLFARAGRSDAVAALWRAGEGGAVALERSALAEGLRLEAIDWAGNAGPLPETVALGPTPLFVTGLPVDLALTALSVSLDAEPALEARRGYQEQRLSVANYTASPLPFTLAPEFDSPPAAGRRREDGWRAEPARIGGLLPPAPRPAEDGRAGEALRPRSFRYEVSPDPDSTLYALGPGARAEDRSEKWVRLDVEWRADPPASMTLYRVLRLRGDIEMVLAPLASAEDPGSAILQARLRHWTARPGPPIEVRPWWLAAGDPPLRAGAVLLPAQPASRRGDPQIPFEAVDLRLPLTDPVRPTWVGLTETGGQRFMNIDVTPYLESLEPVP